MSDVTAPGGGASAPARPSSFKSAVRANVASAGETPEPRVPSGGSQGSNGTAPASSGMPAGNGVQRLPPGSVERALSDVQQAREAAQGDGDDFIPEATPEGDEPEPMLEQQVDDGDPWEAQIHGMTTREFVEAFKEGLIPQALFDKLAAEVEIDGMKRKIGLHELPKHIMRQNDYSRHMAETKRAHAEAMAAKQQFEARKGGWDKMMNTWLTGADGKVDVQSFRRDMRRMGLAPVFVEAAQALGREMQALAHENPEIMQLRYEKKLREEAEEDRQWQDQQRRQRIAQEDQYRERARMTQTFEQQLGELVPQAFQAHQLNGQSKETMRVFQETWRTLWSPGQPVTPELVNQVCASVKEELEDIAHRYAAANQRAANDNGRAAVPVQQRAGGPQPPNLPSPQPLGAQRLAGAPSNGAAARKQLQARPSNFRASLKGKR